MSRSRPSTVWLLAALVSLLLVSTGTTAAAQENYPPTEPPGGPEASVECHLNAPEREVECTGEGFAAGSTVTLELFASGPPAQSMAPLGTIGTVVLAQGGNQAVASGSSTVNPDGTFTVSAMLPCDYDRQRVRAVVEGEDDDGDFVRRTKQVDVSDAQPCAGALGAAGEVDGADDTGIAGLAFSGFGALLLALAAAVLIGLGALLLRHRRNQQPNAAA